MGARIVCLRGPLAGQYFLLEGSLFTFGRDSASSVRIASKQVSRYHASIKRTTQGFVLSDNGSHNGTFVNGQRISTHLLQPDDVIMVGDERFVFDIAPDESVTRLPLPNGTITFLLTDIEGSVQLWENHATALRVLVRHDALFRTSVVSHEGLVISERGEGDSRFAVFTRASHAVAAACAFHQACAAEPWPLPAPLRVRAALHTGEIDLRDGQYYGETIDRCVAIRSLTRGGQVLASLATVVLSQGMLPPGVQAQDLGQHTLPEPHRSEHLFQLIIPTVPPTTVVLDMP